MARLIVVLLVAGCTGLGASSISCGGSLEGNPGGGSSGGTTSDHSGTGGGSEKPDCPNVDYCALRCSGKEAPLYPPACAMPSCACLPGITPRSDWVGTYVLLDGPDATNLVLKADGTFHWTVDGCNLHSGDCGRWMREQPHTIVLLPGSGADDFRWAQHGSPTTRLIVSGDSSTDLVVTIPAPGEKPSAQRWKKGRACAICNAQSVEQVACDEPVESRCQR